MVKQDSQSTKTDSQRLPMTMETTFLRPSDAAYGVGSDTHDLIGTVIQPVESIQKTVAATVRELLKISDDESSIRTFSAGEALLRQGHPAEGLFLILEGTIQVVHTDSGTVIDHDGPGGLLGEMSLVIGQPCAADVLATTPVVARCIAASEYPKVCRRHPKLERALARLISERLGQHDHDALCGHEVSGYLVQRCLNRGGMGVVYQATDPNGDPVALKMLRHRFIDDRSMQKSFAKEAELLRVLDHPNIIRMRDHFLAFRTRFLVLDLCDGHDLMTVIRRNRHFSQRDVRSVLGQVAAGLASAHDNGVIHRDLKPANILMDRDGRLLVTDFGLSRLREIDVPEARAVGTPAYMPPEQFRGADSGEPVDWYAFGCLAYELLTGETLFQASNLQAMWKLKLSFDPQKAVTTSAIDALRRKHNGHDGRHIADDLVSLIQVSIRQNPDHRKLDLCKIAEWSDRTPHLIKN